MTIREARKYIKCRLSPVLGDGEADATAKLILEEVKGYTNVELVMYADRSLLPMTEERIDKIIQRIIDGEPVQYAVGIAWFHGRRIAVDSSVLIPRPETSQLMDMIIDRWGNRSDLSVLDIGTGSGCIAITLALDLPFSHVKAIDISAAAIAVAQKNAANHSAKIDFIEADAFDLEACRQISDYTYDIMVSNPPYVLESERGSMDARVKNYEPALALFVADGKKIDIYSSIASFAHSHLNEGGMLYLEINPLCASSIFEMLRSTGFSEVEISLDYKGIKRFAIACK